MIIYKPSHKAKSISQAKSIAKRKPWYVNYRKVIETGAIVESEGKWYFFVKNICYGEYYHEGWHEVIAPTGIDNVTGYPEGVNIDLDL